MQLIFVHFQVLPAFRPATIGDWWMSLVAPLGLGGLWFAYFLFQLRPLPLVARTTATAGKPCGCERPTNTKPSGRSRSSMADPEEAGKEQEPPPLEHPTFAGRNGMCGRAR